MYLFCIIVMGTGGAGFVLDFNKKGTTTETAIKQLF